MATVRRAPVSVGSLISRLGPRRPETIRLLGQLGVALAERESDSRTDILFRQWLELAGVAYGIENAKEAWPASPDEVLGAALSPALAGFRYAEAVFVLHTYIAFASKIIATELLALISGALDARPTQWISLTGPQLAEQLVKLESGQVTEALRAGDFVSADLFGWYAPELSDNSALLDSVRAVLLAFEELAWARLANARGVAGDLLRDFYAALVPPKMRKALGEFFTPRWIAERLLTRAISLAGTA
jgi:hypothetical protein